MNIFDLYLFCDSSLSFISFPAPPLVVKYWILGWWLVDVCCGRFLVVVLCGTIHMSYRYCDHFLVVPVCKTTKVPKTCFVLFIYISIPIYKYTYTSSLWTTNDRAVSFYRVNSDEKLYIYISSLVLLWTYDNANVRPSQSVVTDRSDWFEALFDILLLIHQWCFLVHHHHHHYDKKKNHPPKQY